jgi:hypothetical protein
MTEREKINTLEEMKKIIGSQPAIFAQLGMLVNGKEEYFTFELQKDNMIEQIDKFIEQLKNEADQHLKGV